MQFTSEQLNQIMLGLCNQHAALRDCVANNSNNPEVKAHWMAKLAEVTRAYEKVQAQYLKQTAEELRAEVESRSSSFKISFRLI